jgi:hypothetical protein
VGSIYLLLGTNLGARLGFLVTFTCLAGFMMLLSSLWLTTASPLNTFKGRIPSWSAQEVVTNLQDAKTAAVRNINNRAHKVSSTEASNVKAAVDAALVIQPSIPTYHPPASANRFAKFPDVTKYIVLDTWEVGGSHPDWYKLQFTHRPHYAVAEFCAAKDTTGEVPFGLPPPTPTCATGADAMHGFVILHYNLGSLRAPPVFAVITSAIFFGLGLLLLHWREKDEAEAAAAAAEPSGEVARREEPELVKV